MDDIRRPYQPQRGDYSTRPHQPNRQPARPQPDIPAHPQPHHQPNQHHHAPAHHQAHPAQHIPVATHQHPQPQSTQHYQPIYHRPPVEQPVATQPVPVKTGHKLRYKLLTAFACLAAAGLLVVAGYSLKSSDDSKTLPTKITSQADYTVYFPSPMPAGYTYMKDTATFQIGQVFYKFNNGRKRVTVKEEPTPNPKPDLSLLAGCRQFDAPIGKAAVGSTYGQPSAVVVTHSTVITLNGIGGVTGDELMTAIKNLKNIGQSSERKT